MKNSNTFSTLFYIRNEKINKHGQVPVYLRITINGKKVEVSTKQWIEPERWNQMGSVKGSKADAQLINNTIEETRINAWKTFKILETKFNYVSAEMLKNYLFKNVQERKTLIQLFNEHNQKMEELIGQDFSKGTLKKYKSTLTHIKAYINQKYKKDDIELVELDYAFIEGFEHYLKTKDNKCEHNSTLKYINQVRKIVNLAIKNGLIDKDPFLKFTSKFKEIPRDFLTQEELQKLEEKNINNERLRNIRDIFLFACYTGLAYADVEKLSPSMIEIDNKGDIWVNVDRTKTGNTSKVPLLPIPLRIIKNYENHPIRDLKGKLLPIPSNQKTNSYLKEIATICDIDKALTFHTARHTFATTVTLTNGVPIESLSKMLAHKSIRTTQIYGKIIDKKVKEDMDKLKDKLYENNVK